MGGLSSFQVTEIVHLNRLPLLTIMSLLKTDISRKICKFVLGFNLLLKDIMSLFKKCTWVLLLNKANYYYSCCTFSVCRYLLVTLP